MTEEAKTKPAESWWIIGLDAADWKYVNPLLEQGRMPVLQNLITSGTRAVLDTVVPPYSGPAWTSFSTGCTPGRHGVFDFIQNIPGTYGVKTMHGGHRMVPPVWSILDGAGRPSVVVNLPMTYPPEKISGAIVSGLDAPVEGPEMTNPPELWKKISTMGDYKIYPTPKEKTVRQYAEIMWDTMELRAKVFLDLAKSVKPPLSILVFETVDMMGHLCLTLEDAEDKRFRETYFETYEKSDELLGKILAEKPVDTGVIIVSDHGMRPIRKLLLLDQWLVEKGYLSMGDGGDGEGGGSGFWGMARKLFLSVNKYLPRSVRTRLRFLKQFKNRMEASLWTKGIRWDKTTAFTCNMQGIYINRKGAYPEGCVPESDVPALLEKITAELMSMTDPDTGEKIIDEVIPREKAYPGEYANIAPDLYIMWAEGYMGRVRKTGPLFQEPDPVNFDSALPADCKDIWKGTHSPWGIFVASGPGVKENFDAISVGIEDIIPTVLAAMNLPVAEHMDGKVLANIFNNPPEERRAKISDWKPGDGLSATMEEEALQEERLRNLGYL